MTSAQTLRALAVHLDQAAEFLILRCPDEMLRRQLTQDFGVVCAHLLIAAMDLDREPEGVPSSVIAEAEQVLREHPRA